MGSLTFFIVIAACCVLMSRAATVNLKISASNPSVVLSPSGSWFPARGAPGEFVGGARFIMTNANKAEINYTFPVKSTTFEFWGYQRTNGGLFNISFDGGSPSEIDAYNPNASGNDPPMRLFSKEGLSNEVHFVNIVNLLDTRPHEHIYGQLNIDHFVLTQGVPDPIPVVEPMFLANGTLAEGPLGYSYHASLSLGADSPTNGGSGATVDVLLDTGASSSWVIWRGCTEDVCAGHRTYKESRQNFINSTINDTELFADGGEANTISTWRVKDTITFSNITVLSAPFGAASHIPTRGETLDGNFGMAKGFCAGNSCVSYPGFVESMYQDRVIKSPVIAFYQLNPTDTPASRVKSRINIGGLDHSKYTGSIDWIPVTNDSLWINPSAQRFVTAADAIIDATDQFIATSTVLDTGAPLLLGLPTDDWNILLTLVGAHTVDGATLFPCTSEMIINFRGTQSHNYTIALANATADNGQGFCAPNNVHPTGDAGAWIAGSFFLSDYYTALYYGEKGLGSTIGFGEKNLGSSAATASLVVGSA